MSLLNTHEVNLTAISNYKQKIEYLRNMDTQSFYIFLESFITNKSSFTELKEVTISDWLILLRMRKGKEIIIRDLVMTFEEMPKNLEVLILEYFLDKNCEEQEIYEFIKKCPNIDISSFLLTKIKLEQKHIFEIFKSTRFYMLREIAIEKIEDKKLIALMVDIGIEIDLLLKILLKMNDDKIRLQKFQDITDQMGRIKIIHQIQSVDILKYVMINETFDPHLHLQINNRIDELSFKAA